MKKFDVDKIKLKVFEIYGKAKEANDLPTLHIIAIISELVSAGIVDDESKQDFWAENEGYGKYENTAG